MKYCFFKYLILLLVTCIIGCKGLGTIDESNHSVDISKPLQVNYGKMYFDKKDGEPELRIQNFPFPHDNFNNTLRREIKEGKKAIGMSDLKLNSNQYKPNSIVSLTIDGKRDLNISNKQGRVFNGIEDLNITLAKHSRLVQNIKVLYLKNFYSFNFDFQHFKELRKVVLVRYEGAKSKKIKFWDKKDISIPKCLNTIPNLEFLELELFDKDTLIIIDPIFKKIKHLKLKKALTLKGSVSFLKELRTFEAEGISPEVLQKIRTFRVLNGIKIKVNNDELKPDFLEQLPPNLTFLAITGGYVESDTIFYSGQLKFLMFDRVHFNGKESKLLHMNLKENEDLIGFGVTGSYGNFELSCDNRSLKYIEISYSEKFAFSDSFPFENTEFLRLRNTNIQNLPNTIINATNLQTLSVRRSNISTFPYGMESLKIEFLVPLEGLTIRDPEKIRSYIKQRTSD